MFPSFSSRRRCSHRSPLRAVSLLAIPLAAALLVLAPDAAKAQFTPAEFADDGPPAFPAAELDEPVLAQREVTTAPAGQTPASPPDAGPSAGAQDAPQRTADGDSIPTTSLTQIIARGGLLMYPILACSVIALAVMVERLLVLRRSRVVPRAFVKRFLEQLNEGKLSRAAALELCRENPSPTARIFAHAVAKWGRPSVELEQAIIDGGEREVNELRRNLRVLNGVATVAPLLGLLGTVVGMIQSFNQIAVGQGMGDPGRLASGIGVALLTTAGGLSVAIPALVMHLYLVSRVDRLVVEMDGLAEQVVQVISAEALEEHRAAPPMRSRTATPRPETAAAAK